MKSLKHSNKGFTVMELLVASVVFSVLLLIVSAAILGLSRQFYKGVNRSKTQEVARTIAEEISKTIQYSKSAPQQLVPSGNVQAWCITNTRFAFVESRQLGTGTNQVPAVLVRGASCTNPSSTLTRGANETEMIGEDMRLVDFDIRPDSTGNVWTVRVKVAMGGDDLLCSPSVAGDCAATTTRVNPTETDLECKQFTSSQFCAVSEYTTVIVRRL